MPLAAPCRKTAQGDALTSEEAVWPVVSTVLTVYPPRPEIFYRTAEPEPNEHVGYADRPPSPLPSCSAGSMGVVGGAAGYAHIFCSSHCFVGTFCPAARSLVTTLWSTNKTKRRRL